MVALDEVYFFETMLNSFGPKRVFLVGIAAGWSTIALGLITPSAMLYGIDNCTEGTQAREGLELTKRIAKKLNISLTVHVGTSPDDVPMVLNAVEGTIDFAFIDGLHTNDQVFLDFEAVLPYMSHSAIIAFHDVLNWNLLLGWQKIVDLASHNGFKHRILCRMASGMGILYRNVDKNVEKNIEAFYQSPTSPCPT